jgi:hypothetical protein
MFGCPKVTTTGFLFFFCANAEGDIPPASSATDSNIQRIDRQSEIWLFMRVFLSVGGVPRLHVRMCPETHLTHPRKSGGITISLVWENSSP